jgi:hypothetical protein
MSDIQVLTILQEYVLSGKTEHGEITVKRVPDQKTVFIEQNSDTGRAIIMNEYKVGGKTYWAGYSSRSSTVYVSLAA